MEISTIHLNSKAGNLKQNDLEVKVIPYSQLDISDGNIRKHQLATEYLTKTITNEGIREPLYVYWNDERQKYLIFDGQRRFIEARKLDVDCFRCMVFKNVHNEQQAREASIKHCIHGKSINFLDIAEAFKLEFEDLKNNNIPNPRKTLETKYSISKGHLSKYLRIGCYLSEEVKTRIWSKGVNVSFEVLYRLSRLNKEEQPKVLEEILSQHLKRNEALKYLQTRKQLGLPLTRDYKRKEFIFNEEERIGVQISLSNKPGFQNILLQIPQRLYDELIFACPKEGKPLEVLLVERFQKYLSYDFPIRFKEENPKAKVNTLLTVPLLKH